MAEGRHTSTSSLSIASMKETEGNRVLRAIEKLAEKIKILENERSASKRSVESFETQDISSAQAAQLFQHLAKAEARLQALQRQLAHIRKIVRQSTSLNADDLSSLNIQFEDKMSRHSDVSSSFGSLPSISILLNDVSKKDQDQKLLQRKGRSLGSHRLVVHASDNMLPSAFSSSVLDIPVHDHFQFTDNAYSDIHGPQTSTGNQKKAKEVAQRISQEGAKEMRVMGQNIKQTALLPKQNDNIYKDYRASRLDYQKQTPSVNSSVTSVEDVLMSAGLGRRGRQRRRSSSRNRSGAGTPLGQFLPSSKTKDDFISHYHVKMNEIPFCSAATTGKTHSLGANLQNLMSMVKVCHPALCNAAPLHRRRSRSAERHSSYHVSSQQKAKRLGRWSSASALDGSYTRRPRRDRSLSLDSSTSRRPLPDAFSDLDLIPVKLKAAAKDSVQQHNACETPGNVCIKTEIKPLSVGSNKVVEVKMTTSTKPKCDRPYRSDAVAKRRQLLKNVQEIQYMVENDQCC